MTQLLRLTYCLSATIAFFCTSLPASATTLMWPDYPNGKLYRIDIQKKTLEAETQPNTWTLLGPVQMKGVAVDAFPPATRVTCLSTDNSRFRYLLIDCTQQVYRFDSQTRTLERLDKTFYRGYNCYSARFLRRDTLYSFGGYGFWHTNNILSYYKAANHEWESLNPSADAPRAIHRGFNGYLPKNDTFFSALGLHQNDSENKGGVSWTDSVYTYSFNRKTWQRLGQLTDTFKQYIQNDVVQKASWFQVENYFVLKYYQSPQVTMLIVEPVSNKVRIWKDTDKLLANLDETYENDIQRSYVWKNSLYFRRDVKSSTGKTVESIRFIIDDLWKNSTEIGAFYEPINIRDSLWPYSLASVLLIIGIGIALRYRKLANSRIHAVDGQPLVVNTIYPDSLNGQERDIFSALLNTNNMDGLNADQLNDILAISDKAPDNQRKIRADVIKSLNLKLKLQWGIEEAVERKATTLDRRMYTYIIKADVKDRIRINKTSESKTI